MAFSAITTLTPGPGAASSVVYTDQVTMPGDGSYATGGSAFDAVFTAKTKDGRKPFAIIPGDCGGYLPVLVPGSPNKIKVYQFNYPGVAAGAATEVPNATDLSLTTFNFTVLSR